jgi:hydrogenase maturation factor
MTGGLPGQVITICGEAGANPSTIATGAKIKLISSPVTLGQYKVITLKTYNGSVWVQVS